MCFDESDNEKFLGMLKNRFEEIQANEKPTLLDPTYQNWKCNKLCHFYKNNWPGTNQKMCAYARDYVQLHGIDKATKDLTAEGHTINFYESPG